MEGITPVPGVYTIWNPRTYTAQEVRVSEDGAQVYAAPSGVYPAAFLQTVSIEDFAAVLAHPRAQVRSFEPAPLPPIGKARAARLHRLMARVGLPIGQHYALAAAALGEWKPVPSLAVLSEREARTVWAHLCRLYPQARRAA